MKISKNIKKISNGMDDSVILQQLKNEWRKIEAREKRDKIYDNLKSGSIEIARYLLAITAVTGILTIAIVAPNIFSAFGKMGLYRRFYKKSDAQKAIDNLRRRKLISIERGNGEKFYIQITSKAKQELLDFCYRKMSIERPQKWDGLWRVVIFDVPREFDSARDAIRYKLKEMGFYQIQKSVFIHPFECEKEINFLKEIYNIHDCVRLIKANYIDGQNRLREKFNL